MSRYLLRNNAQCNIIIPFMGDDMNDIVSPCNEITVTEEAIKCEFVKNLIAHGELLNLGKVDEPEEESVEDLRQQAHDLGIQFDGRWSEKRLKAEIDKASE